MHPEVWEKEMAKYLSSALDNRKATIRVGDENLTCRIASSLATRTEGLSVYEELPDDGMLFIYPGDHNAPFSKADMDFDITIWFFDREGELISSGWENDIAFCEQPYRYVLETRSDAELQGRLEIVTLLAESG